MYRETARSMVEVFVPAIGRVCVVGDTGEGNVTPAQPVQGQTFLTDRRGAKMGQIM